MAVAVGLLVLLAFGVSHQGVNTSLDSSLRHGVQPLPPNAHMGLPVLGSSGKATLTSFRGKILVVNVFASWCAPCKAEAPILEREQRILNRHDGTVVGITYKDDTDASENFARQQHITYPVLRDVSGTFSQSWGINGVPETFVINRRGRVVALRRYQLAGSWLQQTVAPLLGQAS